jgi:trehalose 6-phosphate synthase
VAYPGSSARFVLASNRGPVSFVGSSESGEFKRGAGGLAGALDPVARRLQAEALWVAAATSEADRRAVAAGGAARLREALGYPVRMLDIEPSVYSRYYDDISNRMLWFANHDLWDELGGARFAPEEVAAWDEAYLPVNATFAREIDAAASEDALVLLQDYHLAIAPRLLREKPASRTILHFTHSSFSHAGLMQLPERIARGLVDGMLGADLIGFHTRLWAREFLAACEGFGIPVDRHEGFAGAGDRQVWVRAYPIPIDAEGLRKRAREDAARSWARRLRRSDEELLVVRADRAEPSKNILRGFQAWSRLLDRRPDLRKRARFVACVYPSRQSMAEYRAYAEKIRESATGVEARHPGSLELYLEDDFDRSLGALTTYDAVLVNSIMDGMNLVSKEGPALNERSGAVVLSRRAGSFEELEEGCIEIEDPLDVEATTRAIERALDLSRDERAARAHLLAKKVGSRHPEDWINAQLEDLEAIRLKGAPASPAATS